MNRCIPALLLAATVAPVHAADLFLVRHAEKVTDGAKDPALTEVGVRRAADLATLLRSAQIQAVYSTDTTRTRATAAPTAEAAGVEVTTYDPFDLPGTAKTLLALEHNALVVGHSNTTPDLVKALGGADLGPIDESEYDRVYVIQTAEGKATHTLLLRLPPGTPAP